MTDINELMGSAFVRIKLVALVHFFFTANALIGSLGSGSYEYYNILFIMAMFWTMHCKESLEAVQSALIIDTIAVFLDLVNIITHYDFMNGWAIAFSIINLLIRPLSIILLYREFKERGGSMQTGPVFPNGQQRSYQDIDRTVHQPTPTNSPPGTNVNTIF